jgi:hypothetical protein
VSSEEGATGSADDALARAEKLLERLEVERARLEQTEDTETAIEILSELSEIVKDVQAEIERAEREG